VDPFEPNGLGFGAKWIHSEPNDLVLSKWIHSEPKWICFGAGGSTLEQNGSVLNQRICFRAKWIALNQN
jgi:hypothetical protein